MGFPYHGRNFYDIGNLSEVTNSDTAFLINQHANGVHLQRSET